MQHRENCGVCGAPLVYAPEEMTVRCHLCGKEAKSRIYCPNGHYICDACHRQETIKILRKILASTKSKSPLEILEIVMADPIVPMHGPDHHVIVPAAIITAVKNAGYDVPENALEQAISRGSQVPGGWCGYFGDCGAGVGVGIAVSVLTKATPLTGKQRHLALEATSRALANICDDGPRCCKRAGRKAMETAVAFLDEKLGIRLQKKAATDCTYVERNKECIKLACPYFRL